MAQERHVFTIARHLGRCEQLAWYPCLFRLWCYPQDYDTAKLLKEAETQLKSLGQQLAQLEVAKRQAVEDEDYDRAKMLKVR